MGLDVSDLFPLSPKIERPARESLGKIAATSDFVDEGGNLLYQEVRYEPKDFRQRRPDGNGGWVWHLECNEKCRCTTKLPPVRRVLLNLPVVLKADFVLVVEGPKDCETARHLGLVATTNAGGANAPWLSDYSETLRDKPVCLIADADPPGVAHVKEAARSLVGLAQCVKLIEALPGVPQKGDLTDYVQAGGTRESLLKLINEAPELTAADVAKWTAPKARTVWDEAGFVSEKEDYDPVEFLEEPVLARGNLTEISGPRGLGKSNYGRWVAVKLARAGKRVLYLDRDNPPRKARQALRDWGGAGIVKCLARDKVPALLGNTADWKAFPKQDYDLVILDSWDSTAEGTGEKDSRLPSIAISHILDIVHAENGPAVLVLMNTVRDGTHSRCSGVVEDRADAIFEVRDLTGVQFSGKGTWWEEMPIVGAKDWATRATRRKERERLRMGLVSSKWKIEGPEPSPFALELDFTTSPFSIRDITDEIDTIGAAAREQRAREKAEAIQKATAALMAEIIRRNQAKESALIKQQAEDFLRHLAGLEITQKEARKITESENFKHVPGEGKGHPKVIQLAGKKNESNRNNGVAEGATTLGGDGADFGCPLSMHPTEIDPIRTREQCGSERLHISVDDSLFTPPSGLKGDADEEVI
jgi:hypothetical protein